MDSILSGWFSVFLKIQPGNRCSQPVNKDFPRDHEELMEADCEL